MSAKCKCCGSDDYHIQRLYSGYRQQLFLVECAQCKDELIPVVVDDFGPETAVYEKCEAAWNTANALTNS